MPRRPSSPVVWLAALATAVVLGVWSAERVVERLGIGAPSARSASTSGAAPTPAPLSRRAPAAAASSALDAAPRPDGGPSARADAPPAPGDPTPLPAGRSGQLAVAVPLDAAAPDAAHGDADRLGFELRRLVRDLEFNKGLPEPPQQLVAQPPAPWRPPSATPLPPPVVEALEPRFAPAEGGAPVIIRGRNLRPLQVMFGNVAARIVGVAPGAVTVVAPPGRGAVVVAVTNEDGSYALAGVPFGYEP